MRGFILLRHRRRRGEGNHRLCANGLSEFSGEEIVRGDVERDRR